MPTAAEFVIRAKQDRSLPEQDMPAGAHAYKKVWEATDQTERLATRTLELPRSRPVGH